MNFASMGPPGSALGGLVGRLGGLLGRLGAILGVLERSFGNDGPSWGPLGALLARLGALLGPKQSSDTPREAPTDLAIWGRPPKRLLRSED